MTGRFRIGSLGDALRLADEWGVAVKAWGELTGCGAVIAGVASITMIPGRSSTRPGMTTGKRSSRHPRA